MSSPLLVLLLICFFIFLIALDYFGIRVYNRLMKTKK